MEKYNLNAERRNEQLLRVLKLYEFVATRRFGATLKDCVEDLEGNVCSRTIRRDLATLELAGYLRFEGKPRDRKWFNANRSIGANTRAA